MSSYVRYPLAVLVLGSLLAVLAAVASFATSSTGEVDAVNEPGVGVGYSERHHWSPSQVSVTANGVVTFNNPGPVAHGVEWLGGAKPACSSGVPVGTTPAASAPIWSGTCTFSQPGAYTFYCTVHGAEMTGKITVVGTPTATTAVPTEVAQTAAILNGVVNPEGEATSYYFEYGTTGAFGQQIPLVASSLGADFNGHHVSANLKGLSPNTEYHFELVASYGTSSTVLGGEQVFTTPALAAPVVSTGQASAVTQTGATLGGVVSPEGQETTYRFEYGLNTSYGNLTPGELTGPDGIDHAASAPVTGLAPGTVYHFKLIAENASGPVEGEDRTFTTASPPPPPPPPPPPTTTTTTTPPPTTPVPQIVPPTPETISLAGPPLVAGSLKLTVPRHGSTLRGSIQVSQAGASGRLEVDLLAKRASLAGARHSGSKPVPVGRLVRSSVSVGNVSFSVALSARAKSALRRHHRLALTVKITLTPTQGNTTTLTRSVTLRV